MHVRFTVIRYTTQAPRDKVIGDSGMHSARMQSQSADLLFCLTARISAVTAYVWGCASLAVVLPASIPDRETEPEVG